MRALSITGFGLALLTLMATIFACGGGPTAAEYYRDESTMNLSAFPKAAMTYGTGLNQWTYSSGGGSSSSGSGSSDSSGGIKVQLRLDVEREFNFEVKLKNMNQQPITIDWAHTYYINGQGYKYNVAHQGVPYWSPVSMLKPTQVGPGQTIEDALQPARQLKRDGQWLLAPLTDPQISQGDWPNQLTILMPIISNGVETVHRFDMNIDALDPMDNWGGPWFY